MKGERGVGKKKARGVAFVKSLRALGPKAGKRMCEERRADAQEDAGAQRGTRDGHKWVGSESGGAEGQTRQREASAGGARERRPGRLPYTRPARTLGGDVCCYLCCLKRGR